MLSKSAIRTQTTRLQAVFVDAGAEVVQTDILQPADTLLDLYGEDIRARAFVTSDPLNGELMLRPDFTVPVVQMHMAAGNEPARYTYAGRVFRRQEAGMARAREYVQIGYEVFEHNNPAAADAEVFALFANVLSPHKLRTATGDIAILRAAVQGLSTTDRRKSALMRHIWRPARFRELLERFGGISKPPDARLALLEDVAPMDRIAVLNGLRGANEIAARIDALRQDALDPPISGEEVALLERLLNLKAKAPDALAQVKEYALEMKVLESAMTNMDARLGELNNRGIDVTDMDFEASYGRTSMEYYDGFVFGFYAEDQPNMPPVATGGRYDALTRVLGQGRSIPAVGGVIRPDLLAEVDNGN